MDGSGYNPGFYQNTIQNPYNPPSGCVDYVDSRGVGRWAWQSQMPNTTIQAQVYIYNTSTGDMITSYNIEAEEYRSDLANLGFGNGNHGFSCPIDWDGLPQGRLRIVVYADDDLGGHTLFYDRYYDNNVNHILDKINSNPNVNSTYNRNAAYQYMLKYGEYGDGSTRNYQYRDVGNDCTSFASQCLGDSNAGNLPQISDKTGVDNWKNATIYDRFSE